MDKSRLAHLTRVLAVLILFKLAILTFVGLLPSHVSQIADFEEGDSYDEWLADVKHPRQEGDDILAKILEHKNDSDLHITIRYVAILKSFEGRYRVGIPEKLEQILEELPQHDSQKRAIVSWALLQEFGQIRYLNTYLAELENLSDMFLERTIAITLSMARRGIFSKIKERRKPENNLKEHIAAQFKNLEYSKEEGRWRRPGDDD